MMWKGKKRRPLTLSHFDAIFCFSIFCCLNSAWASASGLLVIGCNSGSGTYWRRWKICIWMVLFYMWMFWYLQGLCSNQSLWENQLDQRSFPRVDFPHHCFSTRPSADPCMRHNIGFHSLLDWCVINLWFRHISIPATLRALICLNRAKNVDGLEFTQDLSKKIIFEWR